MFYTRLLEVENTSINKLLKCPKINACTIHPCLTSPVIAMAAIQMVPPRVIFSAVFESGG